MEATPTQIINYFSGFKQNLVPLFQRPYTWGERQWRTLWEDILAFYGPSEQDSKSTHFSPVRVNESETPGPGV
ncbi:MAG: GmrSD restriction endonuclease domain-containing protein [Terriglobales bacterium]